MDFEYSARTARAAASGCEAFMDEHVYPAEAVYDEQIAASDNPHEQPQVMRDLQAKAREQGLWNLFMTHGDWGAGLTNLEYAPLAELVGRSIIGNEAINCSAPDTGNMEILAMYGTEQQQERWLRPLLDCEIRSAFAMTEPDVASSDATQHHVHDPPRRRRVRPQRPQVVHLRHPRPGLQADHLHGQVRPGRARPTGSRA